MEYLHEENEIQLKDEDEQIGEITFEERGNNRWVITHTYIDPEYRGQGLAETLVEELVERAKDENKEIIKNQGCPYVIDLFQKKPEKYDHITVTE